MGRRTTITEEIETAIVEALQRTSNASLITRASKGAWSYSTVWRVADRHGIALTAGRETMGRRRLSAEERAAVIAEGLANPQATQVDIGRRVGVSRASVSRIEGGRRRHGVRGLQPGQGG